MFRRPLPPSLTGTKRKLEDLLDREAYDWLKQNGIDSDKGDVGNLTDYRLPSFGTWTRYLSTARGALDERKHTPRAGRKPGRSITRGREIERQRGDDD